LKVSPARLDVWIWLLIYGGMIVFSIGFALHRQGEAFGSAVIAAGALAAAAGAVLIWVRSRLRDGPRP
jgi:hypothetical protein